jgi:hypothetical protein
MVYSLAAKKFSLVPGYLLADEFCVTKNFSESFSRTNVDPRYLELLLRDSLFWEAPSHRKNIRNVVIYNDFGDRKFYVVAFNRNGNLLKIIPETYSSLGKDLLRSAKRYLHEKLLETGRFPLSHKRLVIKVYKEEDSLLVRKGFLRLEKYLNQDLTLDLELDPGFVFSLLRTNKKFLKDVKKKTGRKTRNVFGISLKVFGVLKKIDYYSVYA